MNRSIKPIEMLGPGRIKIIHRDGTYSIFTEEELDELLPGWLYYVEFGADMPLYDNVGQL